MFPTITINNEESSETSTNTIGKSFLFDFNTGDFILQDGKLIEVKDIEALKIWINKTIRTEKNRFKIYENIEYGVTIEDLIIGSNLPRSIIESELKREITEALMKNEFIKSVTNFTFDKNGSKLTIGFSVNNSFSTEVII